MTRGRTWIVAINLIGVIAAGVCILALWSRFREPTVALKYTIAIRDPRSERIEVAAELEVPRKQSLRLDPLAPLELMRIDKLRALTTSGKELPIDWRDGSLVIATGYRGKIVLRYEVWPGALARHGHQGMVSEQLGLVAGRLLFFLPHRVRVSSCKVRFELPAGWRAVSAWEPSDDGWLDPRVGGRFLRESLESSSLGFGVWDSHERTIEGNRLEIHLWAGWPAADRARIARRAERIFEAFQQHFGFRLRNRFVVVFVPDAPDKKGVIAAYWSNGLGNSMDDSPRTWSLFAHRIAHVLNRDYPYGTHLAPHRIYLATNDPVSWFNEGMASLLEVWAPLRAGVFADDRGFESMWEIYEREHLPLSPRYVAAAREPQMHDPDFKEYLHYAKAPIFMQNLDHLLRTHSGGQKDLAGYAARVYLKYGEHRGAVPFFEELEWYAGFDLSPFFEKYVVDDDILMPLWSHALASNGPRQVVARVAGEEILADEAYRRLANDAARAPSEIARLVEEKLLERELRARAPEAMPPELLRVLPWLPERTHAMMVRKMRESLSRSLFGGKGEDNEQALDAQLAEWRRRAPISGWRGALPNAPLTWRPSPPAPVGPRAGAPLRAEEGACALRIARAALHLYVERGRVLDATQLPDGVGCRPTGALLDEGAAFVTLRRGRETRGCVGSLEPSAGKPLWLDVVENVGRAALHDGRYRRVRPDEIDGLQIEVSVLSPLRTLKGPAEIRLGRDGLALSKAGRRALFLPWVPTESGWDQETTLTELARKAGLPDEAWKRDAKLASFETQVFVEPER